MKKKLIAAIGLSLIVTANSSSFVYATPMIKSKQNKSNTSVIPTNKNFSIEFYNNLGEQALKLDFDPETMKIEMIKQNDKLGNDKKIYMKFFLYNSKDKKVQVNKVIKDGSTEELSNILNGKNFNYGDVIGIDFRENYSPKILNSSDILSKDKMNYYKITENGLVPYTPDIVVNKFEVTAGDTKNVALTGEAKPNSNVSINIDNQKFTGLTNNQGDFNININDKNGFSEKTIVNVTMESEIGKITELVNPILVKNKPKEEVTTKKENMKFQFSTEKSNSSIENSRIQIINGWGSLAGCINFNPKTMKLEVNQYNAYLGHNSNNFFNVEVYNPIKGEIIYSGNLAGNDNTSTLTKLLNGKQFEYGDIITISYDSLQGKVQVNNGNVNEMNTTGKSESFEITKSGIIKSTLKTVKVNSLDILGATQDKITQGVITGKTSPDNTVNVVIGNEKFTGQANTNGDFSIPIKDDEGFTINTKIRVLAKNEGVAVIYPSIKEGIKIQNSKVKFIDQWGSCTAGLQFDPVTMQIKTYKNYDDLYIRNNMNISVCSKQTGAVLGELKLNSNTTQSELNSAFNLKKFEYGDILSITTNLSSAIKISNGTTNLNLKEGTTEYELTKTGLVPYTPQLKVNPLEILNGEKVTKAILTGKTIANEEVIATIGTKKFTAVADKQGNYSINIEDNAGFTPTTTIKVFSPNEGDVKVLPILKTDIKIQNSKVKFIDQWGSCTAGLQFDPITMQIKTYENYDNLYIRNNMNISVCSKQTGAVLGELKLNSNTTHSELNSAFNFKKFEYGDILSITTNLSNAIKISNGKTNLNLKEGTTEYELTKTGLVPYTPQLKVNQLAILNGEKVTKAILTGKTIANEEVIATIGTKKFTAVADKQGNYAINIDDNDGFTPTTAINVFSSNEGDVKILPTLERDIKIQNTKVKFINQWGNCTAGLQFDPITMEIKTYENYDNLYIRNNMNISVCSKQTGAVLGELKLNSNTTHSELNSAFNFKKFEYGDILSITTNLSNAIKISNGTTNLNLKEGTTEYELTKTGLVPYTPQLKVNPLAILNGEKVTKAILTGKTIANEEVIATIGTKKFTAVADKQGNYAINIEDNNGFTPTTAINVFSPNEGSVKVLPVLESDIKIQNNTINIDNVWNENIGTIKFNPIIKKIEFTPGRAGTNPYLSNKSEAFGIFVYKKNGEFLKSIKIYGGSHPENDLKTFFNNIPYEYGEIIRIDYKTSSKINISNFDNQKSYLIDGDQQFKITKTGLTKVNLQKIDVNAFDILGTSNDVVTKGTLTGKVLKPESVVNIKIGNKEFTTKSNEQGEFSINLTDENGFVNATKILVWTQGELASVVHPIAVIGLGIGQTKLQLKDNSLGIAQTMVFDPSTMKIINSGNSFAVQLIDKNTGEIKASLASGNFNAFTSNNNLNGATFEYGDIISIYESEETSLSDGKVILTKGKNSTAINAISKFVSFEITPQGLVELPNKNLTDISALFKGNSTVNVTGKTLPNENVKLYYGNNKTITIKSNKDGIFMANLPIEEATIGSEIRVFLNNQNNQNIIVKYDQKLFNDNNSIQIVNNESFPVINITFAPATNTIHSLVYPRNKTYAGVFYGNKINISILSPTTGKVIKSVTSSKPQEIQKFSDELNNFKYTTGEIIKIQYDKNLVTANVINDKKQIGNTTGTAEYFEITNKGLVNITNKFINVQPLDILGNGKVIKATIKGTITPNKEVTATINGNKFKAISDSTGAFNIDVKDSNGFEGNTKIELSAEGYIPSYIKPEINQDVKLNNSYINFYQNSFGVEATSLCSSIGFNVEKNTFYVNNYKNSFGTGNKNYFTLYLYDSQGEELASKAFTGESTNELSTFINNKKFKYGDVIGLKYNADTYKPIVVNNNTVIGNISGEMEYFKITKEGLIRTDFGNSATINNIIWDDNSLNISANIAIGNSESAFNSNKKIVILNSDNKILASENINAKISDGNITVSGKLSTSDLAKLEANKTYSIELEINGKIMPLYVNGNLPSLQKYLLSGNSINNLTISLKNKNYVTISNAKQISSYLDGIIKDASNISASDLSANLSDQNKILAAELISRVGTKNMEALYNKNDENAKFINWLFNNSVAMQEFLSGPSPEGHTPEGQPRASYSDCLQVWSNIWNTYTNSHVGFNLKLAIATALSNGGKIHAFPSGKEVGNPVERYNIFETLNADGGMLPEFKNLDVSHLCYITNVPIANNQIIPMRNIILQNHNGLVKETVLNKIAYTINYNINNPHTGVSVFSPNFYGKNPSIKTVWYDGGVCGATGRLGATGEQVFGIPAVQTPQTGHNAFIYYNAKNNSWNIGNAIGGWGVTYDADMSSWSNSIAPNSTAIASYNLLYQKADDLGLTKSNLDLYLANTQTTYTGKLLAINEAIKENKLNLGAWIALVNLYKSNPNITIQEFNNLENNIVLTFKEYPMPMYNLLYQLKDVYMKHGTESNFNNYVKSIKNALTSEENKSNIGSVARIMLGQMKIDGLVTGDEFISGSINIQNVWHGRIANISLNGANKELKVVPSGSYTNPYGRGEAFKVSFEKADGTVIKSVVVNHQEAHPGEALVKELNNLKFVFGDKIVIEYINSSIITANDIITKNGMETTMRVNQPLTIFYITKNGLSLVKSGEANKVSVPVILKNSDNENIGQIQELNGEIKSKIIYKNLEIPKGYKLNSVLFNGNVIYTGDSLIDAQYAIGQEKYRDGESIEILINKTNTIDNIGVKNEIAVREDKLKKNNDINTDIQNTQNSHSDEKKVLKKTIDNANRILQESSSVSINADNTEINLVENNKNLSSQINALINNLNNAKNNEYLSSSITESKTNLQNSVNNAVLILKNPNATNEEVKAVIVNLAKENRQLSNNINKVQQVNEINYINKNETEK